MQDFFGSEVTVSPYWRYLSAKKDFNELFLKLSKLFLRVFTEGYIDLDKFIKDNDLDFPDKNYLQEFYFTSIHLLMDGSDDRIYELILDIVFDKIKIDYTLSETKLAEIYVLRLCINYIRNGNIDDFTYMYSKTCDYDVVLSIGDDLLPIRKSKSAIRKNE